MPLCRSANRSQPYGSEAWVDRMTKPFDLESAFRPRGRPRKEYPNNGSRHFSCLFPTAFQRLDNLAGDFGVSLPGNRARRRAVGCVQESEPILTQRSAPLQ